MANLRDDIFEALNNAADGGYAEEMSTWSPDDFVDDLLAYWCGVWDHFPSTMDDNLTGMRDVLRPHVIEWLKSRGRTDV